MGTTALVLLLQKAATSQAIRATASALRKSTPDQRLSDARSDATEDASLQVVAMSTELRAVIDELQHSYGDAKRARVVALGQAIIQLIADGHAKPEDFETEAQRAAVFEAIRFSMDALVPEVIPILARLALEPVDHFFRGLCRVVVDLDASEVLNLQGLIEAANLAVNDLAGYPPIDAGEERRDLVMFQREADSVDVKAVVNHPAPGPHTLSSHRVPLMEAVVALMTRNLMTGPGLWDADLALSVSTVEKLKRVVLGS